MIERTLSIVKPDAVQNGHIGEILSVFEKADLKILATKMVWLSRPKAESFYAVHRERPFYGSLVEYMVSGPIVVSVLEGDNAIQRHRELMGATDPAKAEEGTIRKRFGANIERNAVHGSDAPETAKVEVTHFFSDLELASYERTVWAP